MIKYKLTIILSLASIQIIAQNLVNNSSFEQFDKCPNNQKGYLDQVLEIVPGWYSPTNSTPDYYNSCNKGKQGVPNNIVGNSFAAHGNAYVGLILANKLKSLRNYREYVQAKLNKELVKDSLYCVKFYVKKATYSPYSTNQVGAFFSENNISIKKNGVLKVTPQIKNGGEELGSDKWNLICGIYLAIGGENFITIGNWSSYL